MAFMTIGKIMSWAILKENYLNITKAKNLITENTKRRFKLE